MSRLEEESRLKEEGKINETDAEHAECERKAKEEGENRAKDMMESKLAAERYEDELQRKKEEGARDKASKAEE